MCDLLSENAEFDTPGCGVNYIYVDVFELCAQYFSNDTGDGDHF